VSSLPYKRLIPTGIAGLDEILFGGIRNQNSVLIEGMPGTGKTTVSLEFLYRGALTYGEPGLFVTLTASKEQILRDAQEFDWNLSELAERGNFKIIEISASKLAEEIEQGSGPLTTEIKKLFFKRIVIDDLQPLKNYFQKLPDKDFGDALLKFTRLLQFCGITALYTTHLKHTSAPGTSGSDDEQFLADTVISLGNSSRGKGVYRFIEVVKSRGQDFFTGRHSYQIKSGSGVEVYSRASVRPGDFDSSDFQMTSTERSSVGNASLDEMLGGGVYTGSVTLVAGISGTGKSVLGMQFLVEGAKQGKKGLLISLDEHPQQIRRNAQTLDLDLEGQENQGKIIVSYDGPLELNLDTHFRTIKELIEKHKVERVVIDSLASYELVHPQEAREFIFALTSYLKKNLITSFYSYETPELLGVSQISKDIKASAIVDNIILLSYVEISTLLRRALTVPKSRGSKPTQRTKEYLIESGGINILDDQSVENVPAVPQLPLSSYYGVLARSPTRTSPVIDETLASGSALPLSQMPSAGAQRKKTAKSKK
jgi:circadian clock protein KaiC